MLKTGMDRFNFPIPHAVARAGSLHIRRFAAASLMGLWGLTGHFAWAAPQEIPAVGLIVQLRPGAVLADVSNDPPLPLAREGAQVLREHAQAVWQRQHTRQKAHLGSVARQAGVQAARFGSAGSALRLDFEAPQTGDALQASMRRLRLHPDVLSVTPNVRMKRLQNQSVTPNDPLFGQQWHLQSPSAHAGAINMPAAWARTTGAEKPTVVAVVDGGVRDDHPDLAGRLLPGYDFVSEVDFANDGDGRDADANDPGDWVSLAESERSPFKDYLCEEENSSWHGTAIAGQIAAASNNRTGVSGIHWGGMVLPVRVASKCGADLGDLLDGVRWAAGLPVDGVPLNPNPAKVINLSYGGSGTCDAAYQKTVDDITAAGALLVVAGGNASSPLTRPADCVGVLAVAAVRGDGAKAGYSSFGANVALSAPGGAGVSGPDAGLMTTWNSGRTVPVSSTYGALAGTSFAAPLVAGVAGLMVSTQPSLTPVDLIRLLKSSVRPHTSTPSLPQCDGNALSNQACNCTAETCGAGLLDAERALAAVGAEAPTPTPPPASTGGGVGVGVGVGAGIGVGAGVSGGGGFTGGMWGAARWAWLVAMGIAQWRRRND